MIYWSSWNFLICLFFYQIQWWYVTCSVPRSFNISSKFSWRDTVSHLMKVSVRALCGYLLLIEPWKMGGSKCVHFRTSLGMVAVFIVFRICLYLHCSPFSAYSLRTWWLWIEDVSISVYYWFKFDFSKNIIVDDYFPNQRGGFCCHLFSRNSKSLSNKIVQNKISRPLWTLCSNVMGYPIFVRILLVWPDISSVLFRTCEFRLVSRIYLL